MPLSYFKTCDTFRPPQHRTGLSPGNITVESRARHRVTAASDVLVFRGWELADWASAHKCAAAFTASQVLRTLAGALAATW